MNEVFCIFVCSGTESLDLFEDEAMRNHEDDDDDLLLTGKDSGSLDAVSVEARGIN